MLAMTSVIVENLLLFAF